MEFNKWKVQGLKEDHTPDGPLEYFSMFKFTDSELKQLPLKLLEQITRGLEEPTIRFITTDNEESNTKAREIFEQYLTITDGK